MHMTHSIPSILRLMCGQELMVKSESERHSQCARPIRDSPKHRTIAQQPPSPNKPYAFINIFGQVFSLTRNKLHRLPPYLVQFKHLTLLKVDQNPLEWPPAPVLEYRKNDNDPQSMSEWIQHLQQWLEDNAGTSGERKQSDDSITSDSGNDSSL